MTNTQPTIRRAAGVIIASVCAAVVLSACSSGGGGAGASGVPTVKSIQDSGVLRVATLTGDAPWTSIGTSGEQEGFDVDLAHALAEKLGVKVEFTTVDGPGRVAALQSKKADVSIGEFSNTPERDEVVDFSTDYVWNPGMYLVREDSGINSREDLNDPSKTACIGQGGTSTDLVPADLPEVGTLFLPGPDDCLEALKSGQADAITQTPFYYMPLIEKNPGEFKILDGVFGTNHIAVGMQEGSTDLKEFVNDFLKEYQGAGTLEDSFTEWFGYEMPADARPDWFTN
ncbi:transporter substrate-binding domain-containing protein [Microbacterium sp. H1-D42]|uniref:substrate-binding periplasmic protein n=1 Tax=Microbacterium sp. H1-D42 TaxID=2925844 RepID=UPI001F53140B|nr:transporter substrate-binding domain-containing protein [Microbacterium sp. H1-D42]UNK70455.1 transporter substrate-binding domain-containing protein [Microbacterium sp. H1-D42]